jgi:hypothetical protein
MSTQIEHLASNFTKVCTPGYTLWFSYTTCIAFREIAYQMGPAVVSENAWSTTTGKHLNAIDGGGPAAKKARLPRHEFEQKLTELYARH